MPASMSVNCPACQSVVEADVEQIIEVRRQPQLKQALLSGQLNRIQCRACGASNVLVTPLLYHDADNEVLLAFVPPELNLQGTQRDQVVGDLLRELTGRIPKEDFRGYMFQPGQVLTMQGLIEQVLEGDGVTKDMLETQRQRVELLGRMIQEDPKRLRSLVRKHDAEIDAVFFQAALAMMQQAVQEGQEPLVKALAAIQEAAAKHSGFGRQLRAKAEEQDRIVKDVAGRLQALGEKPTRKDILALVLELASDEARLQALVGLVRPALDYPFFQELSLQIARSPVAARPQLEALREQLGELTREADAQAQAALQRAAAVLQAIVASPDTDRAIRENLSLIDESFMAVLAGNIREAESRLDIQASSKLKNIHQKIVNLMRRQMRPELRFVNELLEAPDDSAALAMLEKGAQNFGAALLPALNAVAAMLRQQG
ncbi:MAG: CpXC domain-containing protein, partial [Anaerolineaceae bacterium]|nr:CpXC domain-containing protein [Anaerolineaceae bacterium]